MIVAESERLTRLVNNVLDFSRMEQGRRRYAIESADLACVLRGVAEASHDRLRSAGLTLTLAGCDTPVVLPVDRDAIEQVLVNLLDNAAKYAADGVESRSRCTRCRKAPRSRWRIADPASPSAPETALRVVLPCRLRADIPQQRLR